MPSIMSRNGADSRPGVRRMVSASAIVSGAAVASRVPGAPVVVALSCSANIARRSRSMARSLTSASSFGDSSASTPSTVSSSSLHHA